MKPNIVSTLAAILLFGVSTHSQAAVILSGDFVNGTSIMNTPTLTITEDISFAITSSGNAQYLVFQSWTAVDGNITQGFDSPAQNLEVINNGTATLLPIGSLIDNLTGNFNDMGVNDGFLNLQDPFLVVSGTAVTIKAGSFTFLSNPDFNPTLNGQTFTGEVFLADAGSNSRSNLVTIPEPSVAVLTLIGAVFVARRKRRSN